MARIHASYYKIAVLALLIVVALYVVFFVLRGYVHKESDELSGYVTEQEDWEQKLQKQSEYQKQYDSIIHRRNLFQGLFLRPDAALNLIESIEDLAKNHHLNIGIHILEGNEPVVQDKKNDRAEQDKTVIFQLEVTGAYGDFVRFLYQLESMDPVTSVNSVFVERLAEEETQEAPHSIMVQSGEEGQNEGTDAVVSSVPVPRHVQADISATFFYEGYDGKQDVVEKDAK